MIADVKGRSVRYVAGRTKEVEAVLSATGLTSGAPWTAVPGPVADGALVHRRGITDMPGLYAMGMPWQRLRGSALRRFVATVAANIAAYAVARYQDSASHTRCAP